MLQITAELKEQSSMIAPRLILLPVSGVNLYEFNCAYIPALGDRYYTISDVIWLNGRYELDLRVDVLATYKTSIGNSTQYVARAAAASNGAIKDTIYPITTAARYGNTLLGQNQRQNIQNGYFIMGVLAPSGSVLGSVTYYVLNWRTALFLRGKLLTDLQWTNVTEITEELLQTLFNPCQYIVSYKWVPYSPPVTVLSQVTSINFGYWSFDISELTGGYAAQMITANIPTTNLLRYAVTDANIPKHPQIARGAYLSAEPYSRYYLLMTGYGRLDLPALAVTNGNGFTIYETLDYVSGESILNVYLGAGSEETTTPILTAHSHFAIDMPFAQSDQNILSGISDAASAVSGTVGSLMRFDVGGAIQNAITGITSAISDVAPVVQKGGNSGSFAATGEFSGADLIEAVFYIIGDEDNADLGRPLCAPRQLSTLSGFILCANGHAQGMSTATDAEKTEVEQYLNTGFFYE